MEEFKLDSGQAISIVVFATIVLLEALFPFRAYLHRIRHYGKNAVFAIVNAGLLSLIGATVHVWIFLWIDQNDIGLLEQFELPFWLSIIIATIAFDAWTYLVHLLHHIVPFLWRFHQVHHNDTEMDASTGFRFHPGEILVYSALHMAAFIAFGITLELIAVYKVIFFCNVAFHHSNVALPEKWDRRLRYFLVSPNMHRVHHSKRFKETNSNYASGLSLWDRLFGTYRESDPEKIVLGLEYDRSPECQTLIRLMLRPFGPKGNRREGEK